MLPYKAFSWGILIGAALTVVSLEIWGRRLDQGTYENAQPHIIRPLSVGASSRSMETTADLPRLWFPEASSVPHANWQLRALDGRAVKLGDFSGRVVFLNFWSTTCAPCIEEMPSIERLRNSLRGEPVKFVLVTQEDIQEVRRFASTKPLASVMFIGSPDLPPDLQFQGFPTTFILNHEGAVVYKHTGLGRWDDDNARSYIQRLSHGASSE